MWVLGQITEELQGRDGTDGCNLFITLCQTAREQLDAAELRNTPLELLLSPELRLILQEKTDRRTHNLPTRSEVAALIPDKKWAIYLFK
jgi:hypothetical protein